MSLKARYQRWQRYRNLRRQYEQTYMSYCDYLGHFPFYAWELRRARLYGSKKRVKDCQKKIRNLYKMRVMLRSYLNELEIELFSFRKRGESSE